MEEIEEKFMDLVREQYKRTGGSNGFKPYKAAETLGRTITLPK